MDKRPIIRVVVFGICAGATILGMINVYGDNREVKKLAELAACGKPSCAMKVTREAKTPFGQSFSFQVTMDPPKEADVECRQAYFLVGDWACHEEKRLR